MPQQKRVALTVPRDLDVLLDRLAELEGKPKTKIIIDYLESMMPHAEAMIAAYEALKEQKQSPVKVIQTLTKDLLVTMGQFGHEMSETMKWAEQKEREKQVDWVEQQK